MKPKLTWIFFALIAAPLIALAWLGYTSARDEQQNTARRIEALISARLEEVGQLVAKRMDHHRQTLDQLLILDDRDPQGIRQSIREQRLVRQIFILDADGQLVHPPAQGPHNALETAFLARTKPIWTAKALIPRTEDTSAADKPDWYTWYWGSGLNLIYWRQTKDKEIIGAELDRMALLADLIGELPKTEPAASDGATECVRLVDANGRAIYNWGNLHPPDQTQPQLEIALEPPLAAWRLQYFPSSPDDLAGGRLWPKITALAALVLVVIGLAVYFLRESGREIREARQRVAFVNQVSHELKTPLTNIRLYAELMEDRVDEEDEKAAGYLHVIVSESQRLSRLIANVLSFARNQRQQLTIRRKAARLDDAVRDTVEQFRPSLEAKGLAIELETEATHLVELDPDALGQILGNLLSNVEKYAAAGKRVHIHCRFESATSEITVEDGGPGIPRQARKRVFHPFYRLSGKVTEGVSGTGIGLSIARDIARLHGGDLTLEPSDTGARFKITLATPPIEEQADEGTGR